MGKSDRREFRSQITRVLRHLLKLEVSPAAEPRAGWRATIDEARTEIEGLLEDSPSLRRKADSLIKKQIGAAAKLAADDLRQHGEPEQAIGARLAAGIQERVAASLERSLGKVAPSSDTAASDDSSAVDDLASRAADFEERISARIEDALRAKGIDAGDPGGKG